MDELIRKPLVRPLVAAILVSLTAMAVLGYMVQSRASILKYGTEIRLKTAPVDPHDILRGDYVTLNYDISTVGPEKFTDRAANGKRVFELYLRLAPGADGFWETREASSVPLPAADGTVVLKSLPDAYSISQDYPVNGVRFGIERYYVPDGEGKAIEADVSSQALAVVVKVSDDGTGQISRLELNGKPLYDEPLY